MTYKLLVIFWFARKKS